MRKKLRSLQCENNSGLPWVSQSKSLDLASARETSVSIIYSEKVTVAQNAAVCFDGYQIELALYGMRPFVFSVLKSITLIERENGTV